MSPRLSTGDEHYAGEPTNFIYNSIYFTLTFHFHIILLIIFSQLFDIKQVLFKRCYFSLLSGKSGDTLSDSEFGKSDWSKGPQYSIVISGESSIDFPVVLGLFNCFFFAGAWGFATSEVEALEKLVLHLQYCSWFFMS